MAYRAADNFDVLDEQLGRWTQNCVLKLLSSMFGVAAVNRLTPRQKAFLMLPQL
jgi:hypothetical protein